MFFVKLKYESVATYCSSRDAGVPETQLLSICLLASWSVDVVVEKADWK